MSAIDLTTTEVLTIEDAAAFLRISRNAKCSSSSRLSSTPNGG